MFDDTENLRRTDLFSLSNEDFGGLSTFITENIVPKNISNNTIVRVQYVYISRFDEITRGTSKRALVNYVIWRMINSVSDKLGGAIRTVRDNFYSTIGKVSIEREKWMDCVDDARKYMSHATNALYVQEYSDPETITKVKEMAREILKNFKAMLKNVSSIFNSKF